MNFFKIRLKDKNTFYVPMASYYPQFDEEGQRLTERSLTKALKHIADRQKDKEEGRTKEDYFREENVEVIEYEEKPVNIKTVGELLKDKKTKSKK